MDQSEARLKTDVSKSLKEMLMKHRGGVLVCSCCYSKKRCRINSDFFFSCLDCSGCVGWGGRALFPAEDHQLEEEDCIFLH